MNKALREQKLARRRAVHTAIKCWCGDLATKGYMSCYKCREEEEAHHQLEEDKMEEL